MNTEWLKEFLVIARTGSFANASRLLFISQSALTRHIQSLEKELEAELLERNAHNIKLTPAGISLLSAAREITIKLDNIRQGISPASSDDNNTLNIYVHYSDYTKELTSSIIEFNRSYPSVEVNIHPTVDHHFGTLLSTCQADIAFELFSTENLVASVSYMPIDSRKIFIAASEVLLTSEDAPNLKFLEHIPLVVPNFEQHEGLFKLIKEIERENNIRITNILKMDSIESMFHAVSMQKGIAIIPEQYLKDVPNAVKTITLPELPPIPFIVLFSSNNRNPNIARFIAFIKGQSMQMQPDK